MRKNTSDRPSIAKPKILPSLKVIDKPGAAEYPAYAHIYIDLLPDDGQILTQLEDNLKSTRKFIGSIPEARLFHRYAEGKWTIREILAHVVDDERIYAYRALRFARNDATELPGFDQDHYAKYSGANQREVGSLLGEFALVRQSTIAFFKSLEDAALLRTGVADGQRVSVRALAYHIAGHELRHMNVIKERYLR
jgi:hypothetical protein